MYQRSQFAKYTEGMCQNISRISSGIYNLNFKNLHCQNLCLDHAQTKQKKHQKEKGIKNERRKNKL